MKCAGNAFRQEGAGSTVGASLLSGQLCKRSGMGWLGDQGTARAWGRWQGLS